MRPSERSSRLSVEPTFDLAAMRWHSASTERAPMAASSHGSKASAGSGFVSASGCQSSTSPAWPTREGVVLDDRCLGEDKTARSRRVREYRIDRLEHRLGRAEREVERDLMQSRGRRLRRGAGRLGRWRRTAPDRRPGTSRSTASHRPRRKSCAAASLAPEPAKNSSARRSMIAHCAGLVSCASSTRM